MKRNLLKTLSLTALLGALTFPVASRAQCLCDGGEAPTAVKYTYILNPSSAPSPIITFPKFDPTIGVLSCLKFSDTITLIATTHVTNDAPAPVTYRFQLDATNEFIGPGLTVVEDFSKIYGPILLQDSALPGSEITFGPDTIFENSTHDTYSNAVAGYLGVGNVTFTYTVNGGLVGKQGGMDFKQQIASHYWGAFGLTYYWCPNSVLSTNIKNFTAVKNNKNVNLAWIVGNNTTSDIYEIQISKNGREFFGIGRTPANAASAGASAKYTYQYNPDQAPSGQLYFRIRQISADGKVTYSAVKTLNMDSQAAGNFTAYPNPAFSKVSLQFDAALNGDYKVDVTNQLGQVVISRPVKLKNTNLLDLNLNAVKTPGMYYVRVKDAASGQVYTNKVMINR
jgi:hypothetical protein